MYIYTRNISRQFFLLLMRGLIPLLLLLSCSSAEITQNIIRYKSTFEREQYDYLLENSLVYTKAKVDKKGTLYYTGIILLKNKKLEEGLVVLEKSTRSGAVPWRQDALRLFVKYNNILATENNNNSLYKTTINYIRKYANGNNGNTDPEIAVAYLESLYKRDSYKDAIQYADSLDAKKMQVTPIGRTTKEEALQFSRIIRTLSIMQENKKSWIPLVQRLISSNLNDENAIFVQKELQRRGKTAALDLHTRELLSAKVAIAKNQHEEALDILLSLSPSQYIGPADVIVLKNTILQTDALQEGKVLLTRIRKEGADTIKAYAASALADIYYKEKEYVQAEELYEAFLREANLTQAQKNRTTWRIMNSKIESNPQDFINSFPKVLQDFPSISYFTNLPDRLFPKLIKENQWQLLLDAAQAFKPLYDRPEFLAVKQHHYFILSVAPPPFQIKNTKFTFSPEFLIAQNIEGLYAFLIKNPSLNSITTLLPPTQASSTASEDLHELTPLLRGFFEFGLYNHSFSTLSQMMDTFSIAQLRTFTDLFLTYDKPYYAYLLFRKVAENHISSLTQDDLYRLYPRYYENFIHSNSSDDKGRALILGFIREESAFSPKIVSYANAVGLMQVLPSTAEFVGKKYKITYEPLHSPKINIEVGSRYIQYLKQRLNPTVKVIAAYHGGPTYIQRWEKTYVTSNHWLFAESLPYPQNRKYAKKVSVSAMLYGALYYNIDPSQMLSYLF